MESTFVGHALYTTSGKEIGTVTDVISRPSDLAPEWLTIKSGKLHREHLVPVALVTRAGDNLLVPEDAAAQIKETKAPRDHVRPDAVEAERICQRFGVPEPARRR